MSDKDAYNKLLYCGPVDLSQESLIRLRSPSTTPVQPTKPLPLPHANSCQVFIEQYPDPCADALIDDGVAQPLDLEAYMATIGNLLNLDYFNTAELLTTTSLTNAAQDWHLKSHLHLFINTFKDLMSNPAFQDHIQYAPVKHWTTEDKKCWVYTESNTGKLMWKLQRWIPDKYVTVIVGLLASD
ncbi:hypothetical protein FRC12_013124 [Ceratobasidium sp. 428]|nr:hypothetical protein FRC12_013124 [Ceratobasidium sp. 428]